MVRTHHPPSKIKEYIQSLIKSERLGSQVVFHTVLPEKHAHGSQVKSNWSQEIRRALEAQGIRKLYQHQIQAIEFIQGGQHVIVATPTASGKTLFHRQLNSAVVFICDGIPGGAGINREAFSRAEDLLENTREIISECDCNTGCPSWVHSPKCGSGNRPIDKPAAIYILDQLQHTLSADLSAAVITLEWTFDF